MADFSCVGALYAWLVFVIVGLCEQLAYRSLRLRITTRRSRRFRRTLQDSFGPTTYRFVHGRDIVPTVPPSEFGFHHVGRLLQARAVGNSIKRGWLDNVNSDEPQPGNDFFSGMRLRGLFSGPLSPTSWIDILGRLSQLLSSSIGDHLPDRYCVSLTLYIDLAWRPRHIGCISRPLQ